MSAIPRYLTHWARNTSRRQLGALLACTDSVALPSLPAVGPRLPFSDREAGRRRRVFHDFGPCRNSNSRLTAAKIRSQSTRTNSAATGPSAEDMGEKPRGTPAEPRPSASIIVISPSNEILLLHRVRTSSSFPSAHVFPGGNLSQQDGDLAPRDSVERHKDSITYRTGAIRELFEESGILLAKKSDAGVASGTLLEVSAEHRQEGRLLVHGNKVLFKDWLRGLSKDAVLDTDGLIPFTHWITPTNVPKRFTTQMYIYFLPLSEQGNPSIQPTADGGIENTAADFLPAREWIAQAQRGEIILFPPQFLLLWLCSRHLDLDELQTDKVEDLERVLEASSTASSSPTLPSSSHDQSSSASSATHPKPSPQDHEQQQKQQQDEQILHRRAALHNFILTDGKPPWSEKYICPTSLGVISTPPPLSSSSSSEPRTVLGLDKPGPELQQQTPNPTTLFSGDPDRVILVKFAREGPRRVEVRMRREVLDEMRQAKKEKEKAGEREVGVKL